MSLTSAAAQLFGDLAKRPPDNVGEEIAVRFGGVNLRGWTELRLSEAIDTYAAVELSCPWDPSSSVQREVFRPFAYADLEVSMSGEAAFTGTGLAVVPQRGASQQTVSVTGYALPGKLADCCLPPSAWVAKYDGQTIVAIAEAIGKAMGVEVNYAPSSPARLLSPFAPPEAKIERDGKPWDFLTGLAQQAGLLLSSSPSGELLIADATTIGLPVARLIEGQRPLMSVEVEQSPQEFYSHVTGVVPADTGKRPSKKRAGVPNKGDRVTLQNPLWDPSGSAGERHLTFSIDDIDADDPEGAVTAKLGRMLGNAVSWSITLPTWRDQFGSFWRPNTLVTLTAPGAMVYSETLLLVRSVERIRRGDSETAKLSLVLPEAFSGTGLPARFPWQ